jgi:hypothetical protein
VSGNLHEICACGGSFSMVGPVEDIVRATEAWRSSHACQYRVSEQKTPDWRVARLGLPCCVCDQTLDDVNLLTTLDGNAIHIACRACAWCKRPRPSILVWDDVDDPHNLLHKKCLVPWTKSLDNEPGEPDPETGDKEQKEDGRDEEEAVDG